MAMDRRQLLVHGLFGAGGIGLRALATGIPLPLLLQPARAWAADAEHGERAAPVQRLLLATSAAGCPMNANVPGTYDDANIVHGNAPELAAARIVQRGVARLGARCWQRLPQNLLDRLAFVHHATHTVVHAQLPVTLALGGAVANGASFGAWAAQQLAPQLGCVQAQPLCVTGADSDVPSSADGQPYGQMYNQTYNQFGSDAGAPARASTPAATLRPTALALALKQDAQTGASPLNDLQALRRSTLAQLRAHPHGAHAQASRRAIERHINDEAELRRTSLRLQAVVEGIQGDDADGRARAVAALCALNVAPVLRFDLSFGGDNHNDVGLVQEARAHGEATHFLAQLFAYLGELGQADATTLVALNGFGRTLAAHHRKDRGRDHNGNHNVGLLLGANVAGGVIGGVTPMARDYGATAIDVNTGAAVATAAAGDVGFAEGLASFGKTAGRALGLSDARVAAGIGSGKVVAAALAGRLVS